MCGCFFFNDTATTEIYTLSLHDALPIFEARRVGGEQIPPAYRLALREGEEGRQNRGGGMQDDAAHVGVVEIEHMARSEEDTSELPSRQYLVCRLLLEKKKYNARVVL